MYVYKCKYVLYNYSVVLKGISLYIIIWYLYFYIKCYLCIIMNCF